MAYLRDSANKGGVTSSSLEVLAALSMTDEEFSTHMQVRLLASFRSLMSFELASPAVSLFFLSHAAGQGP
jgi:NAD-specific glutamate dehydrogenase